jgi:MFS family permease
MGVASIAGLFYYGYSPFSLVAGVAMDRIGPRKAVPIGAAAVGIGAPLFASGNTEAASIGRLLQGAGGVFALIGATYIATTSFPASRAATLIGATQMFGMAGGSAGQFVVGPMIAGGISWITFWFGMGVAGLVISVLLFVLLPAAPPAPKSDDWLKSAGRALVTVFRNPQSILCGVIAGLIFIPTTIFDMIWGVRYLQEARGLDYATAVLRSSMVPFGWIIGCPLLGFVSDRIGRRKPVISAGAVVLLAAMIWILFGPAEVFPPYVLGLTAGIASGAAMLPYTVIKEANPPALSGTATGVINFLNFTFSALLTLVFGWLLVRVGRRRSAVPTRTLSDDIRAAAHRRGARSSPDALFEGNRTGELASHGRCTRQRWPLLERASTKHYWGSVATLNRCRPRLRTPARKRRWPAPSRPARKD